MVAYDIIKFISLSESPEYNDLSNKYVEIKKEYNEAFYKMWNSFDEKSKSVIMYVYTIGQKKKELEKLEKELSDLLEK